MEEIKEEALKEERDNFIENLLLHSDLPFAKIALVVPTSLEHVCKIAAELMAAGKTIPARQTG